jgi:hypothetical protein
MSEDVLPLAASKRVINSLPPLLVTHEGKRKPLSEIPSSPPYKKKFTQGTLQGAIRSAEIKKNKVALLKSPQAQRNHLLVFKPKNEGEVDENTETFVVRQRVSARKPSLHPVVSRNLVGKEKCLLNRLKLKQFEFGVDPCLHQVMKVQVKPIQELSNKFESCSQRLLTYTFE